MLKWSNCSFGGDDCFRLINQMNQVAFELEWLNLVQSNTRDNGITGICLVPWECMQISYVIMQMNLLKKMIYYFGGNRH